MTQHAGSCNICGISKRLCEVDPGPAVQSDNMGVELRCSRIALSQVLGVPPKHAKIMVFKSIHILKCIEGRWSIDKKIDSNKRCGMSHMYVSKSQLDLTYVIIIRLGNPWFNSAYIAAECPQHSLAQNSLANWSRKPHANTVLPHLHILRMLICPTPPLVKAAPGFQNWLPKGRGPMGVPRAPPHPPPLPAR